MDGVFEAVAGAVASAANLAAGDDNFEPQARARSNTWPLPEPSAPGGAKKNSSRRNAWGNLSYADLITQAICAAPEQRLTLSQIYEHMVQHVAYFKDKGDSNSSAGWKNSIRHNLSLHNRFMRVQNEGTGKSSWWMINPDAKPGKSARRRAVSMETSKFEKRRGRVKKKVDAMRSGGNMASSTSPASSVSESLDLFPDSPRHFQSSPDFRPRAASNASSCGGRLSPIMADPDWFGATPLFATPPFLEHAHSQQQLDSMGQLELRTFGLDSNLKTPSYGGHDASIKSPFDLETSLKSPYSHEPNRKSPYGPEMSIKSPYGADMSMKSPFGPEMSMKPEYCGPEMRIKSEYGPEMSMKSEYGGPEASVKSGAFGPELSMKAAQAQYGPEQLTANMAAGMRLEFGFPPNAALASQQQQQQQQQFDSTGPRTVMGQLMGALNHSLLDDLNLNIETMHGGFDCNVDEVIKHELSVDGSLEFNFQPQGAGEQQQQQQQQQDYPGAGHWVH